MFRMLLVEYVRSDGHFSDSAICQVRFLAWEFFFCRVLRSFPNVLQVDVWIGLELCHIHSFQVLSGSSSIH